MEPTTFSLNLSALRAALLCAAKKDIRTYLQSVYLDGPRGLIVGTDGHRMFVGKAALPPELQIMIPRDLCERVLKTASKLNPACFAVLLPDNRVRFAMADGAAVEGDLLDPTDGKYPDYTRVIPATANGEPAVYNPDYLTDARDALRHYSGFKRVDISIAYNGTSPGVVHFTGCDEAMVIIMPIRDAVSVNFPRLLPFPTASAAA
jgi:hypothetical protein